MFWYIIWAALCRSYTEQVLEWHGCYAENANKHNDISNKEGYYD